MLLLGGALMQNHIPSISSFSGPEVVPGPISSSQIYGFQDLKHGNLNTKQPLVSLLRRGQCMCKALGKEQTIQCRAALSLFRPQP